MFWFKFFNSYNSLIYIAFFKGLDTSVGRCRESFLSTYFLLESSNPVRILAEQAAKFYRFASMNRFEEFGYSNPPAQRENATLFFER